MKFINVKTIYDDEIVINFDTVTYIRLNAYGPNYIIVFNDNSDGIIISKQEFDKLMEVLK